MPKVAVRDSGYLWGLMVRALAIAISPVLLGALFAVAPNLGSGVLGRVRTGALAAALAVVLLFLLPSAMAALGGPALLLFAGGLMLPMGLERLAGRLPAGHRAHRLGVELAFLGLCVHQLVDGLAIGGSASLEGGLGLGLSIAAHTAPLVAVTTVGYAGHDGLRIALTRVGLLAGVTALGVLLGGWGAGMGLEAAEPALKAALAGLLLHTLGHGLYDDLPQKPSELALDLLAAALGVALPLAFTPSSPEREALAQSAWDLALASGPALLIGLVAAVGLHSLGAPSPRWAAGVWTQCVQALGDGLRRPLAALGAVPLARARLAQGVSRPAVVVGLLLAPELALESLLLSVALLGWRFAAVRLVGALILAFVVAWALSGEAAGPVKRAEEEPRLSTPQALSELSDHLGPWALLGILIAALVHSALPEAQLSALEPGPELLLVTVFALPSTLSAVFVTPLLWVLLHKGLSPGAALVGALLGTLAQPAALGLLWRQFGPGAAARALAVLIIGSWTLASLLGPLELAPLAQPAAPGPISLALTLVCGLLLLGGLARVGLRAWIGLLTQGSDSEGHPHPHAAAHGHDPEDEPEHSHGHSHEHAHHHHHHPHE